MDKFKVCPSDDCQNTFEDLVNACSKHKKAALDLKDVCESQKKKLREYRETNSKLYDDIADIEDDIKEKDNFSEKLRKQRNDLEIEVKHLLDKVERKNEDILRIESTANKKEDNSNDIIKALEHENEDLKEQLKIVIGKLRVLENEKNCETLKARTKEQEMLAEVQCLEEEIQQLQEENDEKDAIMKQIEEEKKVLNDKVHLLEAENEMDLAAEDHNDDIPTFKTLEEELEEACKEGEILLKTFSCKECDVALSNKNDLKKHMKEVHIQEARMRLFFLQKNVTNQTNILATSLNELMKKKNSETKQPCICKRFCHISHAKHNWNKLASHQIIESFGEIKSWESENGEAYCI